MRGSHFLGLVGALACLFLAASLPAAEGQPLPNFVTDFAVKYTIWNSGNFGRNVTVYQSAALGKSREISIDTTKRLDTWKDWSVTGEVGSAVLTTRNGATPFCSSNRLARTFAPASSIPVPITGSDICQTVYRGTVVSSTPWSPCSSAKLPWVGTFTQTVSNNFQDVWEVNCGQVVMSDRRVETVKEYRFWTTDEGEPLLAYFSQIVNTYKRDAITPTEYDLLSTSVTDYSYECYVPVSPRPPAFTVDASCSGF